MGEAGHHLTGWGGSRLKTAWTPAGGNEGQAGRGSPGAGSGRLPVTAGAYRL